MSQARDIVSSVRSIQNLADEIRRIPISDDIRRELSECLQSISGVDLNILHGSSEDSDLFSQFRKVIILLYKFVELTVNALEACGILPFPFGIICKAITEVVGLVFSRDVASVVINRFTAILEADLKAKCRATCTKIAHCISYMQGLPAADRLQQDRRDLHLQLLASDVPILVGLDEVLFLGEKILDMVKVADLSKTDILFENAQLYCCLATFRELYLLYRFAIQYTFDADAGSVSNVLKAQKTNDEEVLKFLHKPNTETVRLFRCCFLDQWPILGNFLRRRGLYPENLSELNGRRIKIKSVRKSPKVLHPCKVPFYKENILLLREGSNGSATHLEFRGSESNNVFTLWSHCFRPPRQVYCDELRNMCICSMGALSSLSYRWYVLKLHPEFPGEEPCYMIWLASDHQKCLYANWNGYAGLGSSVKPGSENFWRLENVS